MEKPLLVCSICVCLSACTASQVCEENPQCKWSSCGVDNSECPEEYPFRLESGSCLRPDGVRCSGVSFLCCKTKSRYQVYWVGRLPNCSATANCNSVNDCSYGFTRKCNDNGEVCVFGSQILCGRWQNGGFKLTGSIISAINFVNNNIIL